MGIDASLQGAPEFNNLDLVKTGKVSFSYSGGTSSTTTIPHNLGYTPTYLAYLGAGNASTSIYLLLPTHTGISVGSSVTFTDIIYSSTDSTNLYIYANYTSGSTLSGYYIKYFLFKEKAL